MQRIVALLLILLMVSCGEKKSAKIPDSVLPMEKMAEVLVDIHLLEAAMNLNINPVTAPTMNIKTGSDVFKKNNITKAMYDESMDFYSLHPELLNSVYEVVLNDLSKKQAEVMNTK
ncbi:MAG: DUF4296 domain-containing protein [Bacteroidota bacterium]|nr:DUF4296 domain-containing protein [Bacteroidota bacterium]